MYKFAWGFAIILAGLTVSLAAQNPVSLYQLGATTIDTNSGNKSAGTLRVVVATDQPALTNALKVDGSAVTQPASIADGSLVTLGAKADAKSTATDTTSISIMAALKEISFMEQTPASRAVTNAGTFAVQNTQAGTASQNVAQLAGTTTDTNSGNKSAGTLRVVIATDQPALTNKLLVTPDANSAINLAQVGGTTVVNGGVAGSQSVGGTVATNVAITANPLNLGAQAVSSENAAVTTARQVQLVADLVGKLIVLPYANPENFVSGVTAAMTGTTSTSIIAAPASGLRNYLTQMTCTNSHATQGTFILIQDGSGGTTIYEGYTAAVGGGFVMTFPAPLRQPTTATALFVQDVTTGANVICSASGYKGA